MRPYKRVDIAALKSNAAKIRARCKRFYAVVKADAYGHGLRRTVRAAEADGYCVARAEEGLSARLCTERPVIVMGFVSEREAEALAAAGVTAALTDAGQTHGFARAARRAGKPLSVWVKVNTGMNRYGLDPAEARTLSLPAELVETGRFTHLATDEANRVEDAMRSGGDGLSYPATQNLLRLGGAARVGLGLYGYGLPEVEPVMRVACGVLAVRDVAAGAYVGYGSCFRATRPMKVAILGIGYADGLRRTENRGWATVGDRRLPFVGSVCMDVTLADATGSDVKPGDTALLPTADEMADLYGGIPYEFLTCWTSRVLTCDAGV